MKAKTIKLLREKNRRMSLCLGNRQVLDRKWKALAIKNIEKQDYVKLKTSYYQRIILRKYIGKPQTRENI